MTHTTVISIFTLPEYIAIDVPCTNMDLIVASIINSIHVIDKQAHSLHMKSVAEIKVCLLYSDPISLWNRTPPGVFIAFLVTTYSAAWIPRMATTKTNHPPPPPHTHTHIYNIAKELLRGSDILNEDFG